MYKKKTLKIKRDPEVDECKADFYICPIVLRFLSPSSLNTLQFTHEHFKF